VTFVREFAPLILIGYGGLCIFLSGLIAMRREIREGR
jgi:hypothetical protein